MSSSGGSGGASQAALNTLAYSALQNGVLNSGDLAQTAQSINTSTGALSVTIAAANPCYLLTGSNVLAPVNLAGGAQVITPGTPPASTKYAVIGIELTNAGAFVAVKGTDTATQLNTGPLIAANTPAVTAHNLRVLDIAVWNNAGVYNYGDHTTVATQGVNWIDRRPWARGARWTGFNLTASYAMSTRSYQPIDNTHYQARLELTGVPVRMRVWGMTEAAGASAEGVLVVTIDNGTVVGGTTLGAADISQVFLYPAAASTIDAGTVYDVEQSALAAGSHLFTTLLYAISGSVNLGAGDGLGVTVEEMVRPNASNGTA